MSGRRIQALVLGSVMLAAAGCAATGTRQAAEVGAPGEPRVTAPAARSAPQTRSVQAVSSGSVPVPVFPDADRAMRLAAALPEIERLFHAWVERQRQPGAVMAVLIDGRVAGVYTAGARDVAASVPVTPATMFRIASMTKSFTALAILKLRDQGRLSLDHEVARWIPELAVLPYPTGDSPPLTIRHLLTHSEGFPEDNPWGDRQLAQSDSTVSAWLRAGIPFSNAPGIAYEYSNYGFALLGRVVAEVSGRPYDEYLAAEILQPLGLASTTLQLERVPAAQRAIGYRRAGDGWAEEVPLAHGAFGAMGGLWTNIEDLASYVAFHMSAYPPRDDAEAGPVRRASVRELQQPWRATPAFALRSALDSPLQLNTGGYGYGLRVSQTCSFSHVVGHGGGLPGYGSLMRWLPEHGVGLVAMANLTYASFGGLFDDALATLERTGALRARVPQPSAELRVAAADVTRLVRQWSDSLAERIAADNLFLDYPAADWRRSLGELPARHGQCTAPAGTGIAAENALRGTWRLRCERGWLDVTITLAPTRPARVQYLSVRSVLPPDERMRAALQAAVALVNTWDGSAAARLAGPGLDPARLERQARLAALEWGRCTLGELERGDGVSTADVHLSCERGPLLLSATLASGEPRFTRLQLLPAPGRTCSR